MECISGSFLLCRSHRRLNKNLFKNVSPRTPSAPTCPVGGRGGRTSRLVGWEEGFRWAPGPPTPLSATAIPSPYGQVLTSGAGAWGGALGDFRFPVGTAHTCAVQTGKGLHPTPVSCLPLQLATHSRIHSFVRSFIHLLTASRLGFLGSRKVF